MIRDIVKLLSERENKNNFSNSYLESVKEEEEDIIKKEKKSTKKSKGFNSGIDAIKKVNNEKSNINDRSDNYNFNPWKAEWLFTPKYKEKRKEMIHQIRAKMDLSEL